jgi:phosphoribosylaminoimidazolecarboxamide formyltransferase / IMP cyclohydrolase
MNPHQSASIVAGHGPRVINGEPSMINYLDALNGLQLVREADAARLLKAMRPASASPSSTTGY